MKDTQDNKDRTKKEKKEDSGKFSNINKLEVAKDSRRYKLPEKYRAF